MGVTMSHRFDQDKSTLQEKLRSGRNGRIDYIFYSKGATRLKVKESRVFEGEAMPAE